MSGKSILLGLLTMFGLSLNTEAQCPPNIDFEYGTTAYWTFYTGTCCPGVGGAIDATTLTPPINGRHNLMTGAGTDIYGGFPVVDAGGGSFCMRLGYDTINYRAEKARYYVHVPSGSVNFDLVYRYAMVLENPAGHPPDAQPRFTVDAVDSATGLPVPCASYTYVSDPVLPGFFLSPVGGDVLCKDWTTASLNLTGLGGTTVIVDFQAGDCGYGGHWGYGYFDLNCGLFAVSGVTCNDTATTVTLSAPFGYGAYHWYDSATFSILYGATQTITIPMPATLTHYAVILTPYVGYGCPDTLYTTVSPSHLALHPTPDTLVCSGTGATITAGATDVALPLTYSWAPAAGLSCTNCANPVATPAVATQYTVTVTNAIGCTKTTAIRVALGHIATHVTSTGNQCFGDHSGTGTVVVDTGIPPFAYSWSTVPVQTTSRAVSLTGEGAGPAPTPWLDSVSYDVTVTDITGCRLTKTVWVHGGPRSRIYLSNVISPDSCDIANGSMRLDSLRPGVTYNVHYDLNGVPQTRVLTADAGWHIKLTQLDSGTYSNITVDPVAATNFCSYNMLGPVRMNYPPHPYRPVLSVNYPICVGNIINLSATTPSDSVVYLWNGPNGFASIFPSPTIIPASFADSGMHYVVIDRKNCFEADSIMVHVQPLPALSMATNSPVCSGDTLKLQTNSATGATSYSWNGPGGFVSYLQSPAIGKSTVAAAGQYTVTVALNGCFSNDTVTAFINQTPDAPQVTDTEYCQGAVTAALTPNGFGYLWYTAPSGGVGTVTPPMPSTAQPGTNTWYVSQTVANCEGGRSKVNVIVDKVSNPTLDISDSVVCKGADVLFTATGAGDDLMNLKWDFGNGDSLFNVNPARHSFDHPNAPNDSMIVTATAYYKVCPVKTISRMVRVYEAPEVYLGPDTTICPGSVAFTLQNVNVNSKNASGVSWKWSTGETSPSIIIKAPGVYYVKAGLNGCYNTDTLVVANDCYINYPNVFSPNGDGLNDYFFPRNLLTKGLSSFKLEVYNRWGQLVFTTNTLDGRGWDGKFNDVAQPEGVYVYNIDATFKDGQKEHHTGNVTLLR